jgi:hypothetical protein
MPKFTQRPRFRRGFWRFLATPPGGGRDHPSPSAARHIPTRSVSEEPTATRSPAEQTPTEPNAQPLLFASAGKHGRYPIQEWQNHVCWLRKPSFIIRSEVILSLGNVGTMKNAPPKFPTGPVPVETGLKTKRRGHNTLSRAKRGIPTRSDSEGQTATISGFANVQLEATCPCA